MTIQKEEEKQHILIVTIAAFFFSFMAVNDWRIVYTQTIYQVLIFSHTKMVEDEEEIHFYPLPEA